MSEGSEYKFVVTETWHYGPALYSHSEKDEDEDEDEDDDCDTYTVQFPALAPNVISVFEMAMDEDGTGDVKLLKTFETSDAALDYAKRQYQRYSGDAPFVQTGTDESCHPIGKRQRIEDDDDDEEVKHDLTLKPAYDDENLHWIMIMTAAGGWDAKSLNPYAVW